ncbi:nucleoside deaminase [Halopseudomonas yangmingensis]|uniref:tRNA(Arg) A34 adenosine deaminase TadA n=1 Tax=Halopseudomonas yangmingensis TaxID=1720063 RepID=A0A1I4QKS7_9GAMM|nr:nucleoside deaminase [Halopseudomonas yangmingensis]SFM40376.1 tRNA(Arg) A34 adenosine deaminase TadA [Halopseudomonas yangmingensis]
MTSELQISVELPAWLAQINHQPPEVANEEAAMQLLLQIVQRNVADGGGPFAAAVLDPQGRLLSIAANRVVQLHSSLWHAEMLALLLAQRRIAEHQLGAIGACTLVSSCEPCAMCLGAIPFAGIRRLVCAARGEDAEAIGFDEGCKPPDWQAGLHSRGISIRTDLLREPARQLLLDYREQGGVIYAAPSG